MFNIGVQALEGGFRVNGKQEGLQPTAPPGAPRGAMITHFFPPVVSEEDALVPLVAAPVPHAGQKRAAARPEPVQKKTRKLSKTAKQHTTATPPAPIPRKPGPGDLCPWWKPELAAEYAQLPHASLAPLAGLAAPPTDVVGALRSDTSLVQGVGRQPATSWFSVKATALTHTSQGPSVGASAEAPVPWRARMACDPLDAWSADAGACFRNATDARDKAPESKPVSCIRALKTRLRLSRDQERLLKLWSSAYRFVYNHAVRLVQQDKRWMDAECAYLNAQLVYESTNGVCSKTNAASTDEEVNAANAKSVRMKETQASLGVEYGKLARDHPWLAQRTAQGHRRIPTCILKEACRDVRKAQKSNEGRRKTHPQHRWRLQLKRRGDDSGWTMQIPMQALSAARVAPRPETRRPRRDGAPHPDNGPPRSWTRVTLAPRTGLGDVWLTEAVPGGTITKAVSIGRDKRGRWYMNVPYEAPPPPPTKPLHLRTVGADDPGDRVAATVYSPATGEVIQYAVGRANGGKDRLFRLCERLDGMIANASAHFATERPSEAERNALRDEVTPLRRERDRVLADEGLSPVQRDACAARLRRCIRAKIQARYGRSDGVVADTPSARRERKKRMAIVRAKIKNLVREAHCKMALDMARRWDTLILPPFQTKQMVQRHRPDGGRRKLHSKVARSLMTWSHYQQKIHIKRAFLRMGGEVLLPGEEYTTMCCGTCGRLGHKHSKEDWTCAHCGAYQLRDPSAARNIFLKLLLPRSTSMEEAVHGKIQPTNPRQMMCPGDGAPTRETSSPERPPPTGSQGPEDEGPHH